MEAIRVVGGIGFVAAFFAGIAFWTSFVERAKLTRRERRVSFVVVGNGVKAKLLRNGVKPLRGISRRFLNNSMIDSYVEPISDALNYHNYWTSKESVLSLVIAISILVLVVFSFVVSAVFGLAFVICFLFFVSMRARKVLEQRRIALREAIPEALQTMSSCFNAGYSLTQTLYYIANETVGPLGELFKTVCAEIETGSTIDEALDCLKHKSNEAELFFLAAALEIQHRTGSSMKQVLHAARESVLDEIKLKQTLKTQTAQAKLSAQIVSVMPFVLIAVFSLVSEGFLAPFFESLIGMALLAIALGMQALGIFIVRRMLKVEVV